MGVLAFLAIPLAFSPANKGFILGTEPFRDQVYRLRKETPASFFTLSPLLFEAITENHFSLGPIHADNHRTGIRAFISIIRIYQQAVTGETLRCTV